MPHKSRGDAKGRARGSAGFQPVLAGILPVSETRTFREKPPSRETRAVVFGKMPNTAGWKPALPRARLFGWLTTIAVHHLLPTSPL